MKLLSLRIEGFRKFRSAWSVADLEPGINLFVGPNEAGKSTVVTALRAAFFERCRSTTVDHFRPWGDSAAVPTIELQFDCGGHRHHLVKSFLGRKRCDLTIDGSRRLEGADAEDYLADLLGFQYAARGESRADNWGIPGLLWIGQGRSQEIDDPVRHAFAPLRAALQESLGEVASQEGDAVLGRIEAERNELLTASKGQPRGKLAEAIAEAARIAPELESLRARVAEHHGRVARLATLRDQQLADDARRPWESLEARERESRAALEGSVAIQRELAETARRAREQQERVALLRGHLQAREIDEAELAARRQAVERAVEAAAAAASALRAADSRREAAEAAERTARQRLEIASRAELRRQARSQRDEAAAACSHLANGLELARGEQSQVEALSRTLAALTLPAGTIETLREQGRAIAVCRARLETVATRVRYALQAGSKLRGPEGDLSGEGEILLAEDARFELPGIGTLDIAPGGRDLPSLRAELASSTEARESLLRSLRLASVEEAEARQQEHDAVRARLGEARARLKALAPEGVDRLTSELARQTGLVEAAAARLTDDGGDESAAEANLADARAAADAAASRLRDALEAHGRAAVASRVADAEAAQRGASADDLARRLADPARDAELRDRRAALTDALAGQEALAASEAALRSRLADLDPALLSQDVERFGRSAAQARDAWRRRAEEILRLEAMLEADGAQGLDELCAGLQRDLEQAVRRRDQLQSRADALDHLLGVLTAHRRALTLRLQAPLQRHLDRYVERLFPRAQVRIDEDLRPGPIVRPGVTGEESGEVRDLSFGAREQMGIVSRLAYADLLREAGRPTLLILDDALVHTDDERLDRMKRLLYDAGSRHQILVLTCHPRKWGDLGVPERALG